MQDVERRVRMNKENYTSNIVWPRQLLDARWYLRWHGQPCRLFGAITRITSDGRGMGPEAGTPLWEGSDRGDNSIVASACI